MNGNDFLDILCGSATQEGLLDKNPDDTKYRKSALSWLNLVLRDISTRTLSKPWNWTETTATVPTVIGQHTYDPPDGSGSAPAIDNNKLLAIYDRTQDITYKFIPYDKFVRLVADPSNNKGNPYLWTWFAGTVRLLPIPTSIFTLYLDYIRIISSAIDGATAIDVPDKYIQVVMDGVIVYGYRFDPELGDWKAQQAIYESGIARMAAENAIMIAELPETQSHRTRGRELTDIAPIEKKTGVWV